MKILKNLILIILIITLIYLMYYKYVKKEELVTLFGKSILIVATESMKPEIEAGELIIISKKQKYNENDIVTYKDEDGFLITHRIVEIEKNIFTTKGDANNLKDNSQHINQIKGKVIFHSKILGFFVLYLLKPTIFTYMLILIFIELSKNRKNLKIEKIKS